jgi:hypothetical protein
MVAAFFTTVVHLITGLQNSVSASNLTILVPSKMGFNELVKWEPRDELPLHKWDKNRQAGMIQWSANCQDQHSKVFLLYHHHHHHLMKVLDCVARSTHLDPTKIRA